MDFDHVRGTKVDLIGRLVAAGREAALREELAKCELVCANCHRIRTHRRGYRKGSSDDGMLATADELRAEDGHDGILPVQGRLI